MIARDKHSASMKFHQITEESGNMLMDFASIDLDKSKSWSTLPGKERMIILISGEVQFSWDKKIENASRNNFLDDKPVVLHLDSKTAAEIVCVSQKAELAVAAITNDKFVGSSLILPAQCSEDIFGTGIKDRTAERKVRNFINIESHPDSMLTGGEVVNYPGCWSSFPPHSHRHPEIYYYRFNPAQGFGISVLGEQAFKVKDRDCSCIPGDITHSQCAAPGYAMYYIWIIPHLPGYKWDRSECLFDQEHLWMLEDDAKVYPKATQIQNEVEDLKEESSE